MTSRLSVAIVVPGFPVRRDEPGLAAVVDLVEQVAAVHDVRVICLRHPPSPRRYRLAGASVQALGLGRRGPLGRALVMAAGVMAIVRAHRRAPIHVIHGMWADEPGAVAVAAARVIGRPVGVSALGGELAALADIAYGAAVGRGGRWTVAMSLGLADVVTAGSGELRQAIASRWPARRVELAPLGVDTSFFSPRAEGAASHADGAASDPRKPNVLFVGSLEPVKDPQLMLRTFAVVAATRPAVTLTMVGTGRLRAEVEREARRLGIGDRVTLAGQLPRAQMPDVYRAASVLCVTSRHESQSMAAIEAAACGVPIVGTRVGALPDLGAGAACVDRADHRALARELSRVLDDPGTAARMSSAGRAAAVERYELGNTTERFLDLYEQLVKRGRRAPRGC